jgi:preprotein translocase subunit SecB
MADHVEISNRNATRVQVERIYLRELSFESPRAPEIFDGEWKPNVHLDIKTKANNLSESRFEVVMTVTLSAMVDREGDEVTGLIVEMQQAGVFHVDGVDGAQLEQVLAITCPNILFPYVREAFDNLAVRGTFPPFMLGPVDFSALYTEAVRRRQAAAGTLKETLN